MTEWREAWCAAWRFIYVLAVAGIIAAAIALSDEASSHEADKGWSYPWECCHDQDCAEISPDRVKPAPGGYLVDGKFHVEQKDVRHSPDGNYHACFPKPDFLKCLFVPPNGS